MKRDRSHEIDTEAQRIFSSSLPSSIVFRGVGNDDYGIDGELEVFQNHESTGVLIKVQLKGTENANYIENNSKISFNFPMNNGEYLLEQIEIPAIIVLVDVISKAVFWVSIQNHKKILHDYQLAKAGGQKTFTIYFSVKNTLPSTLDNLMYEVKESSDFLAARAFSKVSSKSYSAFLKNNINDIDAELSHLSEKYEVSLSQKLSLIITQNNFETAKNLLDEIVHSAERSLYSKFDAILKSEDIFLGLIGDELSFWEKLEFDKGQINKIFELTNTSDDNDLKLVANGYSLLVRISESAIHLFYLQLNSATRQKSVEFGFTKDPYSWEYIITIEKNKYVIELWSAISDFFEFMLKLIETKFWRFTPYFISNICFYLGLSLQKFVSENQASAVETIEMWIQSMADICLSMLHKFEKDGTSDDFLQRFVTTYSMIVTINRSNKEEMKKWYNKANSICKQINDQDIRKASTRHLNNTYREAKKPKPIALDVDQFEHVQILYEDQAKLMGIRLELADLNIDDEANPLFYEVQVAKQIKAGIKDLNPTRVLQNCIHMNVMYSYDVQGVAESINLFSTGNKIVGCIKHPEHGIAKGTSLDAIHNGFDVKFCQNCRDKTPHNSDWKYTGSWHEEQIGLFKQAHKDFYGVDSDN